MNALKIFTDGACSGNPGNGGWGVVVVDDNCVKKYEGSASNTTNNRMELTAAIEGIQACPKDREVVLYTDSKYVKDGITSWITNWKKNDWKTSNKKLVKNQDLWIKLDGLNNERNVSWHWVRGHQIDDNEFSRYNNIADQLARDAVKND